MSAHEPGAPPAGESEPKAESGRPAWSTFKSALESAGFRPSRRRGQNFLLDENLVRAIVRDAGVGPGDRVLEVGVGCGFLTLHLLRAGVELVGVEIDERLLSIAEGLLAHEREHVLVHADALASKHALDPAVAARLPREGPWHLVSNLPYSIAGPLLCTLADLENPPLSMTVLVQLEVARRIAGRPGTDEWGPLSVRLRLDYEPRVLRTVAPGLFWPRPEVESALLRLDRRAERPGRDERIVLMDLVTALFQRRRQTLARILRERAADPERAARWLSDLGIPPDRRAEDLELSDLRALALRMRAEDR